MKRVWKPGDYDPRRERAQRSGFRSDATTIREAVKSLVVLGVLEARAGEGWSAQGIDLRAALRRVPLGIAARRAGDLDDLVDVPRVARWRWNARAAPRDATLWRIGRRTVRASIREMQVGHADDKAFMESDTRFRLVYFSRRRRNPISEPLGSTIQSMARIWYPKTYYIPETKGRTVAEHTAIADAIAGGKETEARGGDAKCVW